MRTLLKTIAMIAIGLFALGISAAFLAAFLTSGIADTAERFLQAVRDGDNETAYALLAKDVQADLRPQELRDWLGRDGLGDYREASWGSRSSSGGVGELSGTITTGSGEKLPVSFTLIQDGDDWKIYAIRKPEAGLQDAAGSGRIPAEAEQVKLVRDTMHAFAVSVRDRDMSTLHAHVANLWQKQFSVQQFDESYAAFYQFGDALMVLDSMSPVFTRPAAIDEENLLVLKGRYETRPSAVTFTHRYIYEGMGWKLIGLEVNIRNEDKPQS